MSHRSVRVLALLVCATLTGVAPLTASAAKPARESDPAASSLKEIARAFEAARRLPATDRVAELSRLDQSVASLLRGDPASDDRAAAHFLSGAIASERDDHAAAEESFRRALKTGEQGAFADDAEFAAIRAMEAGGRDLEAAKAWARWSQRHPGSPLAADAALARAWNAMRRGELVEANRVLADLATAAPWSQRDPRVALARASASYLGHRPVEALAALGPSPAGAPATYLAGLCYAASGSLLRAAASFQEVAERWPGSPLRDDALLAKANTFLAAHDFRSASDEFARVATRAGRPEIRAEAELRGAGALILSGRPDSALVALRGVVERHAETDVAARAQFLIGETLMAQGRYPEAIVELNQVLTRYFQHAVAASAQYRVARCLDAMGRRADATGSYRAVVAGYPLQPEAPAAAYLAGLGLMSQNRPLAAAPYFQLVLDRYTAKSDTAGRVVFASPEHQELVEASLCMLEYAYHRSGNLGQLSGAPHLLLQRMPPSRSTWRAYALLIDADASAAQARFPEAQAQLERLSGEFPDHPVGAAAARLLAWTYARQGRDSLAIATEERLVARFGASGSDEVLSGAVLDIAHERFNQKRYREAAGAYEDFLHRFPAHPRRLLALYQAGLCYLRMNHAGDAVDRWELIVRDSADAAVAERAWARAGDLYFQADRFGDARRCYLGLLEHFANSPAASLASLRLAQCEYNAGRDAAALEQFSKTIERFPGTGAAREARRGTELALYRLSRSPNGDQVMARLIEQFPTSPFAADAQFQIAKRRYQEKRWTEAADGFRRVVSQFPAYSAADQAQFLLADAYAQAGAADDSRLAYEQFLSFFESSELRPSVQFRLGLLRFAAKDYMPAAVAFTQVLADSAPLEVTTASRYNLALCQRLLGQTDLAREELERYRKAWPNDGRAADIAYQLGDLDDAADHVDRAAAEFERALASRPSARLATELGYRLGRCRERLNDPDGALKAYRRAGEGGDRNDPFRLTALARSAALHEARHEYTLALAAYRDIIQNAKDRELVAAATGRASALEARARNR